MMRPHPSLSALEFAILRALADGWRNKEIAAFVGRSKSTVDGYVRRLCHKFGARCRAQLVTKAFCQGTLKPGLVTYSDPEMPASVEGSGRKGALTAAEPERTFARRATPAPVHVHPER